MNLINKYKTFPVQIRASFWFLISSFLQRGISIITTPIFTRILSTNEYGNYNVFNSWLGIVSIIVTLNLYCGVYMTGLVKFSDKKTVYTSALQGLTLTLCTVWTLIYLVFQNYWNNLFGLTTVQMLSMLIMVWTSTTYAFWATNQRVEYKYKVMIIVTLLVSFAKPILGIVFVLCSDDKVTARILALVVVELVGYSWTFFYQMFKGKVFYDKEIWKYALSFNIPLIPHYLSAVILNNSDRIMIEKLVGASEAGIYSLAYSISMLMILFNSAAQQTLLPWIYQKIKEKKQEEIHNVVYPLMAFIGVMNILIILFAPEVVRLFAPSSYFEAIYVIPPIALSVFFMFIYDVFVPFEFYFEKTKYIATSSIISAILNMILNFIFIPQFGYMAAGYTTLICYIMNAILHFLFMRKVCIEEIGIQNVYKAQIVVIVSVLMCGVGFIFLALYDFTIARYIIALLALFILFFFRNRVFGLIKQFTKLKKVPTN